MEARHQTATDRRGCSTILLMATLCLCGMPATAVSDVYDTYRKHDIRFLIDGSGSMRVSDPDNRRGAALGLVAGLMPPGQRSGVWVIAQQAENIVPVAETGLAWRGAMAQASAKLTAVGGAADLEQAIFAATSDWSLPDPRFERHLIILFDGFIDFAGDETDNAASRQRVLQETVSALASAEVTVHAIALSEAADRQLMMALAAATNGRFELAESAAGLERAFARVLTNVVAPNAIPLQNNEVLIDSSVHALTVLGFRKSDNDKATLVSPGGQSIVLESVPPNIDWHREPAYELVTIRQPEPGTWRLLAGIDPDNFVVAESALEIAADGLSSNVAADEKLLLRVAVLNNSRPVRDQAFLETIDMAVAQVADGEPRGTVTLRDDGTHGDAVTGDGIFTALLEPQGVGEHVFTIMVNGINVQRVRRHYVSAHALPVIATLAPSRGMSTPAHEVVVIPRRGLMLPESMKIAVSGGGTHLPEIARAGEWLWQGLVTAVAERGREEIALSIAGRSPAGREIAVDLEPLVFEGTGVLSGEARAALPRQPAQRVVAPRLPAVDPVFEYVEFEDVAWWVVLLQVLAANVVVAGVGYGAYRWWGKRIMRGDVHRMGQRRGSRNRGGDATAINEANVMPPAGA